MDAHVIREGVIQADEVPMSDLRSTVEGLDEASWVWIDAVDPDQTEVEELQRQLDLHDLAVEDVGHRNQRPKLELYPGHVFAVFRPLSLGSDGVVGSELFVFASPTALLQPDAVAVDFFNYPVAQDPDGTRFDRYANVANVFFTVRERIASGQILSTLYPIDMAGRELFLPEAFWAARRKCVLNWNAGLQEIQRRVGVAPPAPYDPGLGIVVQETLDDYLRHADEISPGIVAHVLGAEVLG